MELQDLPPEVFQRITKYYVAEIGLCEAWKKREVSKTFNAFLTDEILGHQPMSAYSRGSNRRLLAKGLSVFLEYRVHALHGAHDFIPSIIRKSVEKIMQITQQTSSEARGAYIKHLSHAMSKYCRNKQRLIFTPVQRTITLYAKDDEETILICLVVLMGKTELTRKFMKHYTNAWQSTRCLGSPIEIAISKNDIKAAKLLIENVQPSDKRKASSMLGSVIFEYKFRFRNATFQAILEDLIPFQYAILGRPLSVHCRGWFSSALKVENNVRFVKLILDMGFTPRLVDNYRKETLAYFQTHGCDRRHPEQVKELVKLLCEKNILDTGKLYTVDFRLHYMHNNSNFISYQLINESILNFAVRKGEKNLVKALLNAGADADGAVKANGNREYPIWTAVYHWRILKTLLFHGADPEGGASFTEQSILSRSVKGSKEYKLLRKAIKAKKSGKGHASA